MLEKKFGAFIMTFERPKLIKLALERLLSQTFPPEYILVIDNSSSMETQKILKGVNDRQIGYHRIGYNSGPAGAAKVGLRKLTEMGYEWIYWGDDDNPPSDPEAFQKYFKSLQELNNLGTVPGIFGGKGGYLNKNTGRIRSLANFELADIRYPEVDSVPGGHTLLVNAAVIKCGILPNENLFFGFEEFDFCLRVKEKGFKILIDAETWRMTRIKARKTQPNYRWKSSTFGRKELLWREYYSSRNLLVILFSHKYYKALAYRSMITGVKSLAGFKYGWNYGTENFRIQWKAIFHFLLGRFPKPTPRLTDSLP